MIRLQSNAPLVLAGTLCVAALAGCPNAGTAPTIGTSASSLPATSATTATSASSSASATASVSPVGTPTSTAGTTTSSASPTNAATPGAQASAPGASGATTILQGDIYDESAATVDGATVSIQSLDATHPYTANITTASGHYVANSVPIGVQIQVVVTKTNFTTRSRVQSLQANSNTTNTMNFGGGTSTTDSAGLAYFISKYPEVSATIPDADTLNGNHLGYTIRTSEPLDATNQTRFISAVQFQSNLFFPTGSPQAGSQYQIDASSSFLDSNQRCTMVWNAAGNEMTVTFAAPLQRNRTKVQTYWMQLQRKPGADLITDPGSNTLGLKTPSAGENYTGIKLANLVLTGSETTAADRWNATHTARSGFDVTADDTDPTLTAVSGGEATIDGIDKERIELTVSKPALIFPDILQTDGTLAGSNASVTLPANYAFAISDTTNNTPDMTRVITSGNILDNTATLASVTALMKSGQPFNITATAPGFHIQVDKSNANVVDIDFDHSIWPIAAKAIRAYVKPTWQDSTGNSMSEKNETNDHLADDVKDGTLN